MAAPAPQSSDLSGTYLAQRDGAADAAALDDLLRRYPQQQPAESTTAPQQGAATAPATAPSGSIGHDIGAVAEDVGRGLTVDQPRAIASGVTGAVKNVYDTMSDFGDWISKHTGYYGVHVGAGGVRMTTPAEAAASPERTDVDTGLGDVEQATQPKSVTGGLFKGVYQFLTGLALTRDLVPGAGYAASAAKGAVANFAAFDPHQQRLDNLIQKFPALQNPVSAYLAAKPGDSAAEGRFKNAVEGLGLGVLSDGFVKGVRVLRGVQDAKGAMTGDQVPAAPAVNESAFRQLGDPNAPPEGPLFQTVHGGTAATAAAESAPAIAEQPKPGMSPAELQAGVAKGAPEQLESSAAAAPKTFINYARIDSTDDVQRAMQEIADAREAPADSARAGVMSFAKMQLDAAHEDAWNVLQSRREGEPLPAHQMLAVRGLWLDSTDKLVQLAKTAEAAPTPENLFAFKKMQEVHGWISDEALGARAAGARSTASWRIPVGTDASRLQNIAERIRDIGGGADTVRTIAQKVSAFADSGNLLAANEMSARSFLAKTRDAAIEAFRGALLSSPTTQATILASNVSTSLYAMLERYAGSKVSEFLGSKDGVAPGEAAALLSGYVGSFKDGLASAGKAMRTGEILSGIGEPSEARPSAISSQAFNLDSQSMLGRAADFMGAVVGASPRAIMAQHDMSTTMNFGAELNAQSLRQAMHEVSAGQLKPDEVNTRVASLLANPPENLLEASRTAAKYRAFLDEPGKLTNALINVRRQIPALNAIIPFLKIVSRIQSYAFERTALAPLMSEWKAKIAAGGASRDLAMAQFAMGHMLSMTAADMVLGGTLKGAGPPQEGLEQAQEREGEIRDSVQIGKKWYSLNRIHPVGKIMLLGADVAETLMNGQTEVHPVDDVFKIIAGTALAVGRNILDNSYFQGIANLFGAMHDANDHGGGMSEVLSAAGGAVPAGVGAIARATDPYERAIYSLLDEFKSRIPGLSKTLPPARDRWGDPISSGYGPMTDLFSPVRVSAANHSPIDDEILKQGFNLQMPGKLQTFGTRGASVAIDMSKYPAAYSRYLELAGHALKDPAYGLGLKDLLNQIVSGQSPLSAVYGLKSDGPEGGKEVMIRDLISRYEQQAKEELLQEPQFAALKQDVQSKSDAQMRLKLGQTQ